MILGLGDYQYPSGSLGDFNAYFDIDWGPNVPKLYPVLAPQHDQDWRAADPLDYFNGAGRHAYRVPIPLRPLTPYSFDRRAWHFVALPDACFGAGGCDPAGVTAWLDADLAAHPAACTIAYWHQPYFTSPTREHPAYTAVRPWVERLVAHHVDVVLQAHNHVYERFAPQDAALRLDPDGVQAFVVGTGHYHFAGTAPNSVTRQADTYGVLELTLGDGAYSWRFVGVAGQTFTDSGALSCR